VALLKSGNPGLHDQKPGLHDQKPGLHDQKPGLNVEFLVFMVEKSDCTAKNMVFMSGNSVWGV
jgi:hypothetical protein